MNEASFELGNIASESGLDVADDARPSSTAYWGGHDPAKLASARAWSLLARYGWTLWAVDPGRRLRRSTSTSGPGGWRSTTRAGPSCSGRSTTRSRPGSHERAWRRRDLAAARPRPGRGRRRRRRRRVHRSPPGRARRDRRRAARAGGADQRVDVPLRGAGRAAARLGDADPDDDGQRPACTASSPPTRTPTPAGSSAAACGWPAPGRMEELERQVGWAETFGLAAAPAHRPTRPSALFPLMSTERVLGATYLPTDGYLDPSRLTLRARPAGARGAGVRIASAPGCWGSTSSTARSPGCAPTAATSSASVVVDAAGMYAAEVARTGRRAGADRPDEPPVRRHAAVPRRSGPECGGCRPCATPTSSCTTARTAPAW